MMSDWRNLIRPAWQGILILKSLLGISPMANFRKKHWEMAWEGIFLSLIVFFMAKGIAPPTTILSGKSAFPKDR